jgi:hypothetical protein
MPTLIIKTDGKTDSGYMNVGEMICQWKEDAALATIRSCLEIGCRAFIQPVSNPSFESLDHTEAKYVDIRQEGIDAIFRLLKPVEKLISPGRILSPGDPHSVPLPAVEPVIHQGRFLQEPFRVNEGIPGIVLR